MNPHPREFSVPRPFRGFPAPAKIWWGKGGQYASRPIEPDDSAAWRGPDTGEYRDTIEIGKITQVPQIRASWGRRVLWTPVRDEGHHDADIFDFEHWHWHWARYRAIGWKRFGETAPGNTAFASTRNGASASAGPTTAQRTLKSQILTEVVRHEREK